VTNVLGSIGIEHRVILIATPDGRHGRRRAPARASVDHVHRRARRRPPAGHARRRRALRLRRARPRGRGVRARGARQAVTNLDAVPAPPAR
jgi:hypothetical protein